MDLTGAVLEIQHHEHTKTLLVLQYRVGVPTSVSAFLEHKALSVAPCACGVLRFASNFVLADKKIALPAFILVGVDLKVRLRAGVTVEPEVVTGKNLAKFAHSGLVFNSTRVTLPALAPTCGYRANFRLCVRLTFLPIRLPFCDYGTHLQKLSAEKYTVRYSSGVLM